jgi:ATP-dependent Clp protease ATP-binding subunit ClpC
MSMWEPFTERARRCIVLAQEVAQSLGHAHIGTEHILLGILEEGDSLGAQAFIEHGLTTSRVRKEIELIVGVAAHPHAQEFVFSPRAKRTIEFAFEEARQLGHSYIGAEHLALALTRDGEGVAGRLILNLADEPRTIRETILKKIGDEKSDDDVSTPRQEKPGDFKSTARCPYCYRPIAIAVFRAAD